MHHFAAETTPRLLLIPEMIHRIFQLSSDEENVAHACVCKAWNEEATRVIWHDVPAGHLFSLLAAMVSHRGEDRETYFSFSRAITEDDWDRFDRYSSKVHSLRFTQRFDPSVFKEIALGRRRLDFLPNLSALFNAPATPLFAYPTIKRLFIDEVRPAGQVTCWLGLAERRIPGIEHISIKPQLYPNDDVLHTFTSLLRRTSLKKLDVPFGYLNDSNFFILASMPNLERVSTARPFWIEDADSFSVRSLSRLPTNPFQSLQEFSVHLDFEAAVAYITTFDSFLKLRVLKITSDAPEASNNYMALLNIIALRCPVLKVLGLARKSSSVSSTLGPTDSAFNHPNRQLEHVLQSLRHLESLSLQCFGVQGRFPLRHLPLFAHHSKSIKHLHLDIDSELSSDNAISPHVFSTLKTLHFGMYSNTIAEPTEVANFLSRILPPDCRISANSGSGERYDRLELVKLWVPALVKARMEERNAIDKT
ncbi:hypothetical protein CCMSSC00406_0009248 [Pleurotus cornucopiae]|uniref:Uncharacterized protein n=1 Tax=Pleurotus cornucopiae TaxID=5321 RepID=A0ACB7IZB3_PLECO|nr:hypothetical protein CCMSSC00406_0009248 [Pleurotus cornucopiae]